MAGTDPHIRGEDATLRFYQQKGTALKPVYIAAKNFKVTENASEIREGVQGERRDRLDKVTNFYEITFDIFLPDLEFLTSYIEAQDALDAGTQFPLKQSFAVLLKTPRGNFAYNCQEAIVGPIDLSMTGRSDPLMINVKAACRWVKQIPSL